MNKSSSNIEVKDVLKKYFKVFLIASGFLALGVVLFYIIFASKGFYHSDCTDTILWAQAMLDGKGITNPDFNYAALLPFGGQLLMLPFVAIFGYGMTAQIMGMVLFALLFTAALVYFLRAVNMNVKWVSVTVAAVLLFTCSSEKLREIFWCHIIYYSLGVLFLLVGMGLVLNMFKQKELSVKYHILLFIWTALCSINGTPSLTLYTVPVIGAIIAERFFDTETPFWSRDNKKFGLAILNMAAGVLIGFVLAKIINGSVEAAYQEAYSLFDSSENWISNLMSFFPSLLSLCGVKIYEIELFSVDGIKILIRIIGVLIVVITPYVMMCRYKKFKEREYRIMILVHGVLSALLLIGWVFGRLNAAEWRLTPIIVTSVILCVMYIKKLYKKGPEFRYSMLLIIPIAVMMGMFVSEVHVASLQKQSYENERLQGVGDYLKKEGLEYGYATFWNSNIITLLTDSDVQVAPIEQIEGNLLIRKYQSNNNWYEEDGYDRYFILLTSDELEGYEAAKHYLTPNEILTFEKFHILVYDFNVITELQEMYEEEYQYITNAGTDG